MQDYKWILARQKPASLERTPGKTRLRKPARGLLGSANQEPPRRTRRAESSPVDQTEPSLGAIP